MRFFKDNSESIIRLLVNQIGITIFSFFLYTALGAMQKEGETTPPIFKVLISVFCILFYFVLIYTVIWEIGAKDKIRIDAGRAEKHTLRGLLIGLYANIPNLVITGVALIAISLYALGCGPIFETIHSIPSVISIFFISMYHGIIQGLTGSIDNITIEKLMMSVYYFVFPAASLLIAHFAYIMGLHDKRIFPSFSPKKKNRDKK